MTYDAMMIIFHKCCLEGNDPWVCLLINLTHNTLITMLILIILQ